MLVIPKWLKNVSAVAKSDGYYHPITNERLKSQKLSSSFIQEYANQMNPAGEQEENSESPEADEPSNLEHEAVEEETPEEVKEEAIKPQKRKSPKTPKGSGK